MILICAADDLMMLPADLQDVNIEYFPGHSQAHREYLFMINLAAVNFAIAYYGIII